MLTVLPTKHDWLIGFHVPEDGEEAYYMCNPNGQPYRYWDFAESPPCLRTEEVGEGVE